MADDQNWIESEEFKAPFVRVRGRVSRRNEVTWSPCIRTFKGPDGLQHSEENGKPRDVTLQWDGVARDVVIAVPPNEGDYWLEFQTDKGKTLEVSPVRVRWFAS